MDELRAAWRAADDLGVDTIWVWDHFFPLFGDAPPPVAIAVTSKEFAVARPEYSMMAKRSGPEPWVRDTLKRCAPPKLTSSTLS